MLLPTAERTGEIHFYIAKSLPYNLRLGLAFGLMAAGLALQVLLPRAGMAVGVPVVFVGVLLLLAKGYENKAQRTRGAMEWRSARREEVERIITLNQKQLAWDKDAVDITNTRGVFALFGLVLLVAAVGLGLPIVQYGLATGRLNTAHLMASFANTAEMFFMRGPGLNNPWTRLVLPNAAVLLLPFWLTGIRSILKNDRLVTKAKMLLAIEDAYNGTGRGPGEEFQYQIRSEKVRGGEAVVPRDVKAILQFHEGPPEFLGLQMQITINSVQGTDYPYFYCVLVAKEEFGPFERLAFPPRKTLIEPKKERDVYIAVIRQQTTKKTGYHTKQAVAERIFTFALAQTRSVLAQTQKA